MNRIIWSWVLRISLVRLDHVGASQLRRVARTAGVYVYVLGLAGEELGEGEVLKHGRARPSAFGVRLHWCQWIFDFICCVTFVLMFTDAAVLLAVLPGLFSMPAGFIVMVFGGFAMVAMAGVILIFAGARMDVGQV